MINEIFGVDFWEKIRLIAREEVGKKETGVVKAVSMETAGMLQKHIYKIEEVCAILSVSRQTIYQWIEEGLLVPHKVRSRVYFLREDLDKLIKVGESGLIKSGSG